MYDRCIYLINNCNMIGGTAPPRLEYRGCVLAESIRGVNQIEAPRDSESEIGTLLSRPSIP